MLPHCHNPPPNPSEALQTMEIAELITHPEQLDKDTLHALREQVAQYPYYQAARLLFLKNRFCSTTPSSARNCARLPSSCPTAG